MHLLTKHTRSSVNNHGYLKCEHELRDRGCASAFHLQSLGLKAYGVPDVAIAPSDYRRLALVLSPS